MNRYTHILFNCSDKTNTATVLYYSGGYKAYNGSIFISDGVTPFESRLKPMTNKNKLWL